MRYVWRVRASLSVLLLGALFGCSPAKPPRWVEGGAPLALGAATWDRGGGADAVELRENGHVLIDGELVFVIDRVGRVTDDDYEPYAVLLPDGQLVGTDDVSLGRIGVTNASPPGAVEAWLAVAPEGDVTYFDPDGERNFGGLWRGCQGAVLRTCTLVTQLLAVSSLRRRARGFTVGVGVGAGF